MSQTGKWAPLLTAGAGYAALAFAWLAFGQGLFGGFFYDDFSNLDGLSLLNADSSLYNTLQYALNGVASMLGRPLSLLTFALQHGSWDQHPEDFVRVNILLHLLNGALWWWLIVGLQRLGPLTQVRWLPVAACALWVLLPIHGGAVLYVVQRMTVLAATFTLLGLLLYVLGRDGARLDRPAKAYSLMSAGVLVGVGLGTLAKETAALLPLLILVLEVTLLQRVPRPRHWRAWSAIFLWLPAGMLAAYLTLRFPIFLAEYGSREFTLGQRMLTESRVLWMYLGDAFVPSPAGVRLLYDDLLLSVSFWQPWTTAAAVVLWIASASAAIVLRRTAPVFSFAVAWYLAGHLLESSFIALELAFGHRNYLPVMGPALAMCVGLAHLLSLPRARRLRPLIVVAAMAYIGVLGLGSWLSASLWGRPLDQAHYWALRQPESRRALQHYGEMLSRNGRSDQALELYRAAEVRWPDDPLPSLELVEQGCFNPALAINLPDLQRRLSEYRGGNVTIAVSILQRTASRFENGRCPHHAASEVLAVLDAALASPKFQVKRVNLNYAGAMLLYASGDREQALTYLEKALELELQIPLLQYAVMWSLQLGDVQKAWRHLRTAESDPRLHQRARWIYREEIRGMRQLIELYESLPDA